MKRLKTYTIYTILIFFLTGCSELYPNNEFFVVVSMKSNSKTYSYRLLPTKGKGAIFINSKNFYNVGDTLTLK